MKSKGASVTKYLKKADSKSTRRRTASGSEALRRGRVAELQQSPVPSKLLWRISNGGVLKGNALTSGGPSSLLHRATEIIESASERERESAESGKVHGNVQAGYQP